MKIKTPIYLDYNATTPVDPQVFEEMKPYLLSKFGNASSKHSFGYEAASGIKLARQRISELINSLPEEIVFTSGATESINIVHIGIAQSYSGRGKHIISTVIEHPAVLQSLRYLEQNGFEINYLPVNSEGLFDFSDFERTLRKDTILVSIMTANNEIGIVNDIAAVGKVCREKNIIFHTDASQAIGKIHIDVAEMNIDFLTFSGHKFYAPKGTGGIFIRKTVPAVKIPPIMFGGGQERGLRPGTINVPGAAALGKAAELCRLKLDEEYDRTVFLRNRLMDKLMNSIDNISLNGSLTERLPNNLNLSIKDINANDLILNLRDLAFSTASACSSDSDKPSYVLKALGLSDQTALSSIRLSIGRFTTEDEVDYAASRIIEAAGNKRKSFNKVNYL